MTCAATSTGTSAGRSPAPETNAMHTFILAGQSNMLGSGRADELPDDLRAPAARVLVYDGSANTWSPLDPTYIPGQEAGRVGPEVTFGPAMAEHLGVPIGLIKLAVGGTGLAEDWAVHEDPDTSDKLYGQLVRHVHAARASRDDLDFRGMLWMQGERDSRSWKNADAYAANLAALIANSRRDFATPGLPFVAGRVNPALADHPVNAYPFAPMVRTAIESCPADRYAWFDCDDLTKLPDGLHYDTPGLCTMGRRFAEALIAVM